MWGEREQNVIFLYLWLQPLLHVCKVSLFSVWLIKYMYCMINDASFYEERNTSSRAMLSVMRSWHLESNYYSFVAALSFSFVYENANIIFKPWLFKLIQQLKGTCTVCQQSGFRTCQGCQNESVCLVVVGMTYIYTYIFLSQCFTHVLYLQDMTRKVGTLSILDMQIRASTKWVTSSLIMFTTTKRIIEW